MSLVNNLLLLYYFILFAGVVFIVPQTETALFLRRCCQGFVMQCAQPGPRMFVMGSETEGDEYFSA